MPDLHALAGGQIGLLTTTADGGPRTRPVLVLPGDEDDELVVLTSPEAAKVAQVRAHPGVTVAGPCPGGWFEVEGVASVDDEDVAVRRFLDAAGAPSEAPAVLVRVRARRARRWTVTGDGPFANRVDELL